MLKITTIIMKRRTLQGKAETFKYWSKKDSWQLSNIASYLLYTTQVNGAFDARWSIG